MTDYSFSGTNLNDPHNYTQLDGNGNPVLDGQGQPVHPNSVPNGSGDTVRTISSGMSGSGPGGTFPGGILVSGSIQATLLDGTAAGGGSGAATIHATTVNDGTSALAHGTVTVDSTINGGAFASSGGTIQASGA